MMQIHEASQIDVSVIDLGDDERLIREGEAAVELFNRSRDQILPMARGLAAAKRKYPATRDFSKWLLGSPYKKIDKQDRAALIKLGEHEETAAKFLRDTGFISPQTIWAAVKKELQPPPPAVDPTYYLNKSEDDPVDANLSANVEPKAHDARPDAVPSANGEPIEPEADAEPHSPWASGERFDLVLLTPGKRDLKHLRADYAASLQWLRECLPLDRIIKDDVAVVIDTTVSDLPVIDKALLPLFGFTPGKRPRVLLAQEPKSPDVTNARVLVTIERGVEFSAPEDGSWLDDADPVEIAEQLYGDASRSLLVFGSTKASGWHCRTWLKSPSI
jgi:hypothetical protein